MKVFFAIIVGLLLGACDKAENFRIRGDAATLITNDDLGSLQKLAGAASLENGRVWGVHAAQASNFDGKPVIRACVITKFTHRDAEIVIAECVVCYKATPGYLRSAGHREGDWGTFEKEASRCAFVAKEGSALDFEEMPTKPVLVRGEFERGELLALARLATAGTAKVLDIVVERTSDGVRVNGVEHVLLDGVWEPRYGRPRNMKPLPRQVVPAKRDMRNL